MQNCNISKYTEEFLIRNTKSTNVWVFESKSIWEDIDDLQSKILKILDWTTTTKVDRDRGTDVNYKSMEISTRPRLYYTDQDGKLAVGLLSEFQSYIEIFISSEQGSKTEVRVSVHGNLYAPIVDMSYSFPDRIQPFSFTDEKLVFHNEHAGVLNSKMLERSLRKIEKELGFEIMSYYSESPENSAVIWSYGFGNCINNFTDQKYKTYLANSWNDLQEFLTWEIELKKIQVTLEELQEKFNEIFPWMEIYYHEAERDTLKLDGHANLYVLNQEGEVSQTKIPHFWYMDFEMDESGRFRIKIRLKRNMFSEIVDYRPKLSYLKTQEDIDRHIKYNDQFLDRNLIFHNEACGQLNQKLLSDSLHKLEEILGGEIVKWYTENPVDKQYIDKYGVR